MNNNPKCWAWELNWRSQGAGPYHEITSQQYIAKSSKEDYMHLDQANSTSHEMGPRSWRREAHGGRGVPK